MERQQVDQNETIYWNTANSELSQWVLEHPELEAEVRVREAARLRAKRDEWQRYLAAHQDVPPLSFGSVDHEAHWLAEMELAVTTDQILAVHERHDDTFWLNYDRGLKNIPPLDPWRSDEVPERPADFAPVLESKTPPIEPLFVDVAALLSGSLESPRPALGLRSDGEAFIYSGAVNVLFGPPESGKTLALTAIAADVLFAGGNVLFVDIDHNGAAATIARFRGYGVSAEVLSDPRRFRLALPEDKESLLEIVSFASFWKPTLASLDSIGELLPMFGASSNSDDEYTAVHRSVLSAMAVAGIAVLAIDHEAKGQASRDFGAGGAVAKKRAVDGLMLRVSVRTPFTPGSGGKAALNIVKDRHGAVRAISPASGDREPLFAMFELTGGEVIDWKFRAPEGSSRSSQSSAGTDLEILTMLDPPPASIYSIKKRLNWGADRATKAFNLYEAQPNA